MTTSLEFTEDQLCEIWNQHTPLEDDPRDANDDLRVAFEDADGLRQRMRVAPDNVAADGDDLPAPPTARMDFHRTRATAQGPWSLWSRVA
jgi:hypothetical protein